MFNFIQCMCVDIFNMLVGFSFVNTRIVPTLNKVNK